MSKHFMLFKLNKLQLISIILRIDKTAGVADLACDEPGIPLSQAAIRQLIDEKHHRFKELSYKDDPE